MLQDLIDFVAYNLAFNEFTNRAKYDREDCYAFGNKEEIQNFRNANMFIAHNREAIIHFLRGVDSAAFERICPWKTDSNKNPLSPRLLDAIMQRRRTVLLKYKKMGVKTYHKPPLAVKKEVALMWIHHLFLLHNVLSKLHQCLSGEFHDKLCNFMSTVNVKYRNTSTKYRKMLIWMGEDHCLRR